LHLPMLDDLLASTFFPGRIGMHGPQPNAEGPTSALIV
jgi:hypothetical protein